MAFHYLHHLSQFDVWVDEGVAEEVLVWDELLLSELIPSTSKAWLLPPSMPITTKSPIPPSSGKFCHVLQARCFVVLADDNISELDEAL